MDNHPDFIEARRIKKQNEDQLADINNKIASLESVCDVCGVCQVCRGDVRYNILTFAIKLGNDLKTQVETHFTALEGVLAARKAVLLQKLKDKITSIGVYDVCMYKHRVISMRYMLFIIITIEN